MPVINIALREDEYQYLLDEYQRMPQVASQAGAEAASPSFEQWLASRMMANGPGTKEGSHDDVQAINAIEKLITSLQPNGFALAHLARRGAAASESAAALAEAIVGDLKLSPHQTKRLQQLFEYYLRGSREIADLAQIAVTNRTFGALHEAYRELSERTEKSLNHLGGDRAVGRAEGAIAILVSLNVIERTAAKEKIRDFKAQIRNSGKTSWVGKVFGGSADED